MPVLAAGIGLGPAVVLAQGVTIDHKAVGCIVAEQYPKMSACFLPAPNIARGRVHFRASGTTHWYHVEGKREMPCHGFVLPKPKKTIKSVDYYVEGIDTSGGEGRTAEYFPIVVLRASECKKDVPVAPFLTRATVVVGVAPGAPAIIPGFTGFVGAVATGASTGAILGIVAAGGAVAGTAIAVSNNDNPAPAPAPPAPVTTATSVTTTTTTTTTTTIPAAQPFNAVFEIFPNPPESKEPFHVTFSECKSTGAGLKFLYDFDGDGIEDLKGGCSVTMVYSLAGVSASALPPTTLPGTRAYEAQVCVGQGTIHKVCHIWRIVVSQSSGFSVGSPQVMPASRRVAWTSELNLEGGSGQVVVNGESAAFAGRGRSAGAALGRRGVNRVEAQVVEAAGTPGTWRFELDTTGSLQPGTIRVIAGEIALVTESAVVFRLKGRPGERVVFSFRTDR
jgi:hypothetical protein